MFHINFLRERNSTDPDLSNLCKFQEADAEVLSQLIATHFQKVHSYQLVVSYHCQWCNGYIDPAEIRLHAHAHFENLALNKPCSPPMAGINPADSSLLFTDADGKPVVGNIDDDHVIPETQPGMFRMLK